LCDEWILHWNQSTNSFYIFVHKPFIKHQKQNIRKFWFITCEFVKLIRFSKKKAKFRKRNKKTEQYMSLVNFNKEKNSIKK
jgi:hypothetical protein